jgi:hypothetical protein
MKNVLILSLLVLVLTSMSRADLVLEDGEDPNLSDTYTKGGDGCWAQSEATSPVASPTTGNWARYLYATVWDYWVSFTKKDEYVPDDLSAYKDGKVEMWLLWRAENFPSGWEFYIHGDTGNGYDSRVGFSLDGNSFGWANDTWHKISIDVNNGLFDTASGTVDGVAAEFGDPSDDMNAAQATALWSNVISWEIVVSTGWTDWQSFGIEDLRLIEGAVSLPGDANGDGVVNVGDLGILAGNYGTLEGATWEMGDFNGDGAVNVGDLGILAGNYGSSVAASVPEPTCLSLLGLSGLAMIRRKW